MEDWLAIRESFSARSCIPKKELSCGGSKTQSEGMSKIAVLWFGPGKNLLHFCGSPLHPFPYAQRHPSSCGDPLDLGLGLRSTPLDGRQQQISEPGMMSSWFLPPVCFVVRERSRAMWNLGSFTGKGGSYSEGKDGQAHIPWGYLFVCLKGHLSCFVLELVISSQLLVMA